MAERPMTTMSTKDVVELLVEDHEAAKSLLHRFETIAAADRASYFCEVVTELVRHEVAEEHVVYPIVRRGGTKGESEAKSRIAEEARTEALLAELEHTDPSSEEFAERFVTLRGSVLDHARAEETGTFPLLQEMEDAESRLALAGRYEHAKAAAPSHPHPHAPHTPPGNSILGPVAALFDRARDAVRDR